MRRLWTRALLLGAVGLAAGSSAGCAEERGSVNRVQADALAKSFFVGDDLKASTDDPEFYFQTTLVDVGYGSAQDGLFTSTYAQPLSRIKWQITENLLVARVTYERIKGSDGKGNGPAANDGVIAAVYQIESHFDIRHDYNPQTGEESNVVVENSVDRPWYERQYFRVNWGKNLATDAYDFDTLSLVGLYGGVSYEPLDYYINDPTDENAPHFDPDMGYFDVTNKAFAKPGVIDLSSLGWGIDSYPACMLDADFAGGQAPTASCDPVELMLRQSFRKVGEPERDETGALVKDESGKVAFHPSDFEPKEYDGYRFQAYGGFYEDYKGYSRNYGMTDKLYHRMLDHYNIWEKSHYYDKDGKAVSCYLPLSECADGSCVGTPYGADPNRDDDNDGTADECKAAGKGSRCDTFSQKCTLPYMQRTQKPIVWYYTEGSNPEFFEGTEWAAHEWDVAMRAAGTTAKYAECVRVGGDCSKYPVLRSQQSSNWDLIQLAKEVDECRHKLPGADGKPVYGGTNCEAVATKVGTARGYEPEVIELAKLPEALVLCHSPVELNDPAACAPADQRLPEGVTAAQCAAAKKSGDEATMEKCATGLTVRIGDLRYNQVNSIIAPQTPSPWGIMVDSEDPITGEKIASSINVWTHVNDLFSQGVVDQARYIKGELKTEEITDGQYIKDWASAAEAAGKHGSVGQMTRQDVRTRIAAVAGKAYDAKTMGQDEEYASTMLADKPEILAAVKNVAAKLKNVRAEVGTASTHAPMYAQRLQALAGTDIEAELMTKAMQQFAGVEGLPMSDSLMNIASPVRGGNRTFQRQFERFKQNALGERGACILSAEDAVAEAPLSLANLADVLQEKFGAFDTTQDKDKQFARADQMRKFIAQRAQYAVIIHEMGHSIALRHNFVSSSDAFNYRPQYWQLRTKNGTVKTQCKDLKTDGEGCVGPRYYDPITDNERKNLMWMFMQSSVMDYAGETTQDLIGLGAYDFAAARMFYGDAVAVYQDASYNIGTARGRGVIEKVDGFGGLLGWSPSIGNTKGTDASDINYTQYQDKYESIIPSTCVEVDPQAFKPASWDEKKYGVFHPLLDGLIVSGTDGKYTRCKQQPVDYAQWNSLRFPKMDDFGKAGAEANNYYRGGPSIDLQNRTRVPYGFATDRWADLGNSAVYRHDNGADLYELFDFFITQQEVNHIFDNYRRGRQTFSVRNAANRALTRYNEKMRDSAKGVGLLVNIYKDLGLELGLSQQDAVDSALIQSYPTSALVSGIGFDHFGRMMARPEIGDHITVAGDSVLHPRGLYYSTAAGNAKAKLIVPNGASGLFGNVSWGGSLLENTLSDNQGEYDSEYTMNAGSYYGKMYTTMLLTESEDNFISDSITDFTDARYRSISIADVFGEGYRRWLANNLTGDEFIKGVRVAAKTGGTAPDVDPKDLSPKSGLGTTSWWPKDGPEACFPNQNSIVCSQYGADGTAYNPAAIQSTMVVDPLIGWEQQKFLIAWTYVYLPENQKRYWLDRLELKELGVDSSPDWDSRTELHFPNGSTYIARSFGSEVIFGKTVQKGIAARVVEYANELMSKAYAGKWYDKNGMLPDQVKPVSGAWFKADLDADGQPTIVDDGAAERLERYKSLPWFLARMDSWIHVGAKGLYP